MTTKNQSARAGDGKPPGVTVDLRKLAEQAGINMSLWDMGAASLAYSEGVHGVTREHLERFAELLLTAKLSLGRFDTVEEELECAEKCISLYMAERNHARDLVRKYRAEVEELRGLKPEIPPRPPHNNDASYQHHALPRYGLRWNGPSQPVSVPMADGYWTPFHLALEAAA